MKGDPLRRVDGPLKVTGGARYAAEWPLDGLCYGVLVTSTIARGTITSLDTTAARKAPGVRTVLTAENAPRLPAGGRAAVEPPSGRVLSLLQDRTVHYNGEPIAVVVADTFEHATHAASLVRARYRTELAAVDMDRELAHAEPVTEKILGRFEPASSRGDAAQALAAADARVDAVYTTPLETHNAMEPHATIAHWEREKLTLYDATQHLYGVKRFVAKTLGIPEGDVRVVSKFVGGAFGSKGSVWSHVVLAALAARQVGRPVKIVLTRRQMFGPVGARPYTVQHIELGARSDGRVTAIRQEVTSSTSVLEDWVESATLQTRILYDVANVETKQKLVRLNIGTPTFNRGPGESSGTFALESALDELALKLALDPVEIRLRNHADKDPESGLPWSSKSLRACYLQGAERIGWHLRDRRPRAREDAHGLVGLGVATATYPAKRMRAQATARLLGDGLIEVRAATHEIGTGTTTILTQLAADELGIARERVRIVLGDSDLPENPISAGSMTAASTGPAVAQAAHQLRERLASLATDPADVAACRALAARSPASPIEERADLAPGEEQKRYSMHSFGAVFAEVRVDPELGVVRVRRVVGAYGAGRILNPRTATSQFQGGIIYGLAMALTEDTVVDRRTGRYLNADLSEYLVPSNADVPEIDVILVDEEDPVVDPLGVKGIGEIGTTGVAAAVANAVFNATGTRVRSLPITLDKLL